MCGPQDRGVMYGCAYTSQKIWKAILNETGWTTIQLRDRRYDAVIHLVTSADGAEEFYGKNNEARYESIEQAKNVDAKLINAWTGHSQFKIIDNKHSGGFKYKILALLKTVMKSIGLPAESFLQKKFLLMQDGEGRFILNEPDDLKRETFEVEEVFLVTRDQDEIESKIRSRGKEDSYTYIHEVTTVVEGEEIIRKRQISAREFIQLMDQKKVGTNPVEKIRHCFIYENQNFMVDVFKNVEGTPTILRIEISSENEKISIPPFVKVYKEVTGESTYTTAEMGKKDYEMPMEDRLSCKMDVKLDMTKKNSISIWDLKEDNAKIKE